MKKRYFLPVLALCLALALGGCGFSPFRETVQGSGVLTQFEVPLSNCTDGYTLRVFDIPFSLRDAAELKIVIDERLDCGALLETDDNILDRLDFGLSGASPASGDISMSAPSRTALSPTKLTITVGAPVRELAVDGLWKISYDCPSVRDCKLTAQGGVNGDFNFGALESLDMGCSGLSTIHLRCQSVKNCKLAANGGANGDLAFGEMESLDMRLSGLGSIDVSGAARRAVLDLNGGPRVKAFDLTAQDADVTLNGLGSCENHRGENIEYRR
jgi:hypothetical protein